MAEEKEKPRPFDVKTIRYLVHLMSQHDLNEIDLAEGDIRIRLRRGQRLVSGGAMLPAMPVPVSPLPAPTPVTASPTPAATSAPTPPAKKLIEIKSPTVGTFYAQKDPTSPPFVTKGSRVTPTTVVCLIEAMKVYNEIQAECSGVIEEVCVNNKDFVEYNTVLFRVDPTG